MNDNHACWLLSFNLNIDKFSVSNFINKKKIDEIPKLMPAMISFNKPNKNIRILDGFKFNFLMHKNIAIEIRLGAALLKTEK